MLNPRTEYCCNSGPTAPILASGEENKLRGVFYDHGSNFVGSVPFRLRGLVNGHQSEVLNSFDNLKRWKGLSESISLARFNPMMLQKQCTGQDIPIKMSQVIPLCC